MKWLIVGALLATGAEAQELGPRPVFPEMDPARVELGQLLFYDPILSGNRNISCGTCHHPRFGTSDGMSLSIGEGGLGLGPDRRIDPSNPPEHRLPRNAPALWNLGATEFTSFFHDGRLEVDPDKPGGIRTPLGAEMVVGFDSVLAAQAMFPVLAGDEMAGHYSENEVSQAVRLGHLSIKGGAWDRIAARVEAIPEYRRAFDAVLGDQTPIQFTDIANVIADFTRVEWRADDSPFDRAMLGGDPLSAQASRGQDLFYGTAGCSTCHSGWLQTDHNFHAIAMPQIGPGKAAPFETHARDTGRMRVTGEISDQYKFLTPSLRNVSQSGPYGHDGAYASLQAVVRHHFDPIAALNAYDPTQAVFHDIQSPDDWRVVADSEELARISAANELTPIALGDDDLSDLVAFLHSLTDTGATAGRLGVPFKVPSGLPVDQ
ncbi:cytochrome-c peroxidase [Parasedimentitalea marina]|uniref:Cytochrome-c peroxidase n=1 Tax=Parasedimentitalea marina TaxID=2483033 RepID=A0A3T0MZF1_9RHOB|nr:cytochrome-c peroxidase [Parasedimentitalea marina]AZV77119.1 cytochrome-c peroxidase [Parasedimentitalea marina]